MTSKISRQMILCGTLRRPLKRQCAIRKASGKLNPEDCTLGTFEYEAVTLEFIGDCTRSLGGDPDDEDDGGAPGIDASS
jgi:hypothetical protein